MKVLIIIIGNKMEKNINICQNLVYRQYETACIYTEEEF
jgi:hypothetical protein